MIHECLFRLSIVSCSSFLIQGRGSYTFEVFGGHLPELTRAVEQLIALRYNPKLQPARAAEAYRLGAAQSSMPSGAFTKQMSDFMCRKPFRQYGEDENQADCLTPSIDLGVSSSFSSDDCSNSHSISPSQRFPGKLIREGMHSHLHVYNNLQFA